MEDWPASICRDHGAHPTHLAAAPGTQDNASHHMVSGFLEMLAFSAKQPAHLTDMLPPPARRPPGRQNYSLPHHQQPGCSHQLLGWGEPEIHLNLNNMSKKVAELFNLWF